MMGYLQILGCPEIPDVHCHRLTLVWQEALFALGYVKLTIYLHATILLSLFCSVQLNGASIVVTEFHIYNTASPTSIDLLRSCQSVALWTQTGELPREPIAVVFGFLVSYSIVEICPLIIGSGVLELREDGRLSKPFNHKKRAQNWPMERHLKLGLSIVIILIQPALTHGSVLSSWLFHGSQSCFGRILDCKDAIKRRPIQAGTEIPLDITVCITT